MSRLPSGSVPGLRRHVRGYGVVRLNKIDHPLGPWPDPAGPAPPGVTAAYHEAIARWLAGGKKPLARAGREPEKPLLVKDLCGRFLEFAKGEYPAGSKEPENYRLAFAPLEALFGLTPAAGFDAPKLELVRADMLRRAWCRRHANRQVNRVKRLFRVAARKRWVPAAVPADLATVEPLRKGQHGAREADPREPTDEGQVDRVCGRLTPPMAAMVLLLWHTGMRPGEVRKLRCEELDRSDPTCWVFRPGEHKTDWKGQTRSVAIGPRAIAVLRPWLDAAGTGYVFSPGRLVTAYKAAAEKVRKGEAVTPEEAWAATWFKRVPGRMLAAMGETYTADGFTASVTRAKEAAGVPGFTAYAARHAVRERVGRAVSDEAARAVLGQKHISTLSHYGRLDEEAAKEAMRKIG